MLLHGWSTRPGLGIIEPQSTCADSALDERFEEDDPVGLVGFDGVVPLAFEDGDEPQPGLELAGVSGLSHEGPTFSQFKGGISRTAA
jgi:hypothetical protein